MTTKSVAPVLKVANLDRALAYYKEVLGFETSFQVENYAGVRLGVVELHLSQSQGLSGETLRGSAEHSTVYIFCDKVDRYYADIKDRGAVVVFEPKDWAYGMRDFRVRDIDGNEISFGCEITGA